MPEIPEDSRLKVYVLDETLQKKPFGAWGRLYIRDQEFPDMTASYKNPFGEGRICETPYTARILPDGSLDLLEHSGRTIMAERTMGRSFPNLYAMEQALLTCPGITSAECFVSYGGNNALQLTAELELDDAAKQEMYTAESVSAFLTEKLNHPCEVQSVHLRTDAVR